MKLQEIGYQVLLKLVDSGLCQQNHSLSKHAKHTQEIKVENASFRNPNGDIANACDIFLEGNVVFLIGN